MLENLLKAPILVAFITGVLGPILIMYAKQKIEKGSKKNDMVTETLEVSEKIS